LKHNNVQQKEKLIPEAGEVKMHRSNIGQIDFCPNFELEAWNPKTRKQNVSTMRQLLLAVFDKKNNELKKKKREL
jgi:hypothetical protein